MSARLLALSSSVWGPAVRPWVLVWCIGLIAAGIPAVPAGAQGNTPAPPQARAGADVGVSAGSTSSRTPPAVNSAVVDPGAFGGGIGADFTPLIDLIQNTIAPDTWELTGEGTGTISQFPNGVLVDSERAVSRSTVNTRLNTGNLSREVLKSQGDLPADAARQASPCRVISLVQLERACQAQAAAGQPPTEEMLVLAGLERIDRVWIQQNDVLVSGPASPWVRNDAGWVVTVHAQHPVLRLDVLVLALRDIALHGNRWVCSIQPRAANLQAVQQYVQRNQAQPLRPGGRAAWLRGLREAVGEQDVQFNGLQTDSRVAHVLLAADHHMKQIGMGLAEGGPGVPSYLELVRQQGDAPPAMEVLRWWFAYVPEPLTRSGDGHVYQLARRIVRVQSENQMLTEAGQRVPTGASEPLNREFAERFTAHLPQLISQYPIYGELENVYQLGLVASIVRTAGQAGELAWRLAHWRDAQASPVPRRAVPLTVRSIVNAKPLNRRTIVAGVSGGVMVDSDRQVQAARVATQLSESGSSAPVGAGRWWWDVPAR
jgi:hypothetical protein